MKRPRRTQTSIANISQSLLETGLTLLQRNALPAYRINSNSSRPPVAPGESNPSAIAMLLLVTGLDWHLARLKYWKDEWSARPNPAHKSFSWSMGDYFQKKVENLLQKRHENRLKEQLLELSAVRDNIAHPNLYTIEEVMFDDLSFGKPTTRLIGASLRPKTIARKMKRSEVTKLLRIPLIPRFIGYPEVVLGISIAEKFINHLVRRYGEEASLGGFIIENHPAEIGRA